MRLKPIPRSPADQLADAAGDDTLRTVLPGGPLRYLTSERRRQAREEADDFLNEQLTEL